jgi:protein-tyrosine phosphatase
MSGRIDVHGHYLPKLDDGSRSIDESVAMARRMADAGYTHLTCSPHVWPEHKHTPRFILDRVDQLQRALDERGVPITLVAGGELNILDLDVFSMRDEDIISYGMAGKYVLFDFWAGELPDDYWERIARIKKTGAIPIQAHPERIAAFQYHPLLLDQLAEQGVLLQCNLQCLSDLAGVRTRDCAEKWLLDRRYFMLASDAHRIDTMDIRLRGLDTAIEILGEAEVDRLTKTNPAKVIGLTAD